MILVIGTFRLLPDGVLMARGAMEEMVATSRAEDGCEAYCYAEDVCDPGLIHVTEMWRDQASLDANFKTAHLATWRATWNALGIRDRDLRLYEIGEPRKT